MVAVYGKELAKAFVRAFYSQGNVTHLINKQSTDENITFFGPRSTQYIHGRDAVIQCLQQEHDRIAPCRLTRARFRVHGKADLFSVSCLLILRTSKATSILLHHLTLMYRQQEGGRPILHGIHLAHSFHHESTYRMVSARMLSSIMAKERDNRAADTPPLISSFAQSAFITYRLLNDRLLTGYSDELWRMLGYDSSDSFQRMVAPYLMNLLDPAEKAAVQASINRQIMRRNTYQVEYAIRKTDGNMLHVLECGCRDLSPTTSSVYSAIVLDITPLKEASDALMYQISYDPLTGIFNRSAFYQHVQEVLENNPEQPFELMSLDIERFKIINDLFGEETGDRILCYVADFLKEVHLPKSVFGRLHSDIFLLFYPAENRNRERIIKSLKVLVSSFALGYRIKLRFGIYRTSEQPTPDMRLSVPGMVDRAILALSKAKRSGIMDLAEYSETMRCSMISEQAIINDMNDALQNHEFSIYLQPKYDTASEAIVGAEALVRWFHPQKGMIPPNEFIPVFEHNGFIFQLDQYIWEEVCRLLRKWLDEGWTPPPISVNVSRIDFYSAHLVNIFQTLVKKYDLPPELLDLEITESAYTDNPAQIIEVTKQLQDCGFRILMDDFGSGYSSLNMLKDLPVDILKIDLRFLDQSDDNPRSSNILNSIVRMAQWMRMPVVVEGVETRSQVDFLRNIGCEFIQGYFFAKPMPVAEYEDLLRRQIDFPSIDTVTTQWTDMQTFEELLNPSSKINHLFNGIVGGIGLYEFSNGCLEGLRGNDTFFRLLRVKPGVAMQNSRQVLDFILEEDQTLLVEAIEKAHADHQPTETIVRRRLLDGDILWLRARCNIVATTKDRLLLFISWEDLSERYALPLHMQQLIDSIPCGFIICELLDKRVTVHFLNHQLCQMHELDKRDMRRPGKYLTDIVGADLQQKLVPHFYAAAESEEPYPIEYTFMTKTRGLVAFSAVIHATRHPDGTIAIYANIYDKSKLLDDLGTDESVREAPLP